MNQEVIDKQKTQRIYLHDATTTLVLDPDDETTVGSDFGLVFDNHRGASAVACLAVKNYRKNKNSRTLCRPAVLTHNKRFIATMSWFSPLEDGDGK